MQPLELALSYMSSGVPVFPCRHAPEDIVDPSTGEIVDTKAEKSPLTTNGLKAATRFERIIRRWWDDNPNAMVGVPTGAPSGFWVLDLDIKPLPDGTVVDGHEWLSSMEAIHGPLPTSTRVLTANGGTHIWFSHVNGVRNRGGMGKGVDVRGDGGFVIMPGSEMFDGRSYTFLSQDPIAEAPAWLLELVLPSTVQTRAEPFTYQAGTNDTYVNAAVDAELSELASTGQGGRGYQLNRAAFSLGQLVGAGALSRADAEAGLYNAARANGVLQKDGERETLAKIKRGIDAGMREPRDIPEPDLQQQDNTRLVDMTRMIQRGLEKARALEAKAQQDVISEPSVVEVDDEPANDNQPQQPAGSIVATAFKWIDPSTLPRREFAYGTHFIRKYVSVTVSPGGLGKTSASIAESLAMVSGKALLGVKPPQRLRTWIFNAEDPRDELERRIMAACIHYNLKPEDLEGHLFLDSGREQELVVAVEDKKAGVRIQQPIVEAVVEQIERYGIDVMIVDPFVSTHGVNENDNGAIDKVAKLWAQIADYTNCSIDIVHHLRKVADREATVEDARGAVSLIGAARSVRVLNRMSEEQAAEAGMPSAERFGYFYTTYGKSNLTPLSHRAEWRHLASVPLGNGRGLTKPQDFAPVVTEWSWPSAEEAAGGISDEQRQAIVTAVANADYKKSPKAKNWVGVAVAFSLGLDLEDEPSKKRVSGLVRALIKEGALVEKEERDPIRRETAVFVRAA